MSEGTALPNFLIVGAAKSGTTSVYHYLRQHPEVFLSARKEPKYFASQVVELPYRGPGDDRVSRSIVSRWEDYAALFAQGAGARAVGEAGVENLYYAERVIPLIRERLGDPRIVILLRDPVERAFAAYRHLRRDGLERLSFEAALDMEPERRLLGFEPIWHYRAVGMYAGAVAAYRDAFSHVFVRLYDDLVADADGVMRDLFAFLGVDASFEPDVGRRYNPGGQVRWRWLARLMVKREGKFNFRSERYRGPFDTPLGRMLARWNRVAMEPAARARLRRAFQQDVAALEAVIGRDLSLWSSEPRAAGAMPNPT